MQENLFLIKEGKKRESYEKETSAHGECSSRAVCSKLLVPQNQKRKLIQNHTLTVKTMLGTYVPNSHLR